MNGKVRGNTQKNSRKPSIYSIRNVSRDYVTIELFQSRKNKIGIPFSKMIDLLNRLGMTIDEFLYIHRDYTKNPGTQLKRLTKMNTGDKQSIIKNINELKATRNLSQRDQELLLIFEALLLVLKNEYNAAREKVLLIWNRLEKHDNWYLYDIQLINSILYLFPIDVAESIVDLTLKRLDIYKKFRNINQLSANLQINFLLLLIDNKKYKKRSLKKRDENKKGRALTGFKLLWSTGQKVQKASERQMDILNSIADVTFADAFMYARIKDEVNRERAMQIIRDLKFIQYNYLQPELGLTATKASELIKETRYKLEDLNYLLEMEGIEQSSSFEPVPMIDWLHTDE